MRANALTLWLTPSTPPCRAGSVRREIRALSDGIIRANPQTTIPSATNKRCVEPAAIARSISTNPPISRMDPAAAITPSGTWPASRRTSTP